MHLLSQDNSRPAGWVVACSLGLNALTTFVGAIHAALFRDGLALLTHSTFCVMALLGLLAWCRGYRRVAAHGAVWGLVVLLIVAPPFFGGFHGPAFLAWPTVLVVSAIVLGMRQTLLVGVIAIGYTTLMFWLEQNGWTPYGEASALDELLTRYASIAMIGVLCSYTVFQLRSSLRSARSERARAEQMVLERDAELARREKTERLLKHAVDAALQASDAKSRFLANMSHELRTPLNAIIGYSEMLIEESDDPESEEDLQRIESAGRHLLALISDILDLSKIEAGQMMLEIDAVEIERVVQQVADAIRPAIRRNANRLVLDIEELPRVLTDRTRCYQVLLNLASNAAKFTENGTVTIEVRSQPHDWFVVSVRDTGIGISPQELDRLFERFVQADTSTTRKYGGTGLGLVLSRRFTEMLGGELTVESTPGVGSTFHVRLPCIAPTRTGATMLVPETAPTEHGIPLIALLPAH